MSANRRTIGEEPGLDCPEEISFEELLRRCELDPICRVQGRDRVGTKAAGRWRRFNRAVKIDVSTAQHGRWPKVRAVRVEWNRVLGEYGPKLGDDGEPQVMTLEWPTLDWVTPQASNNPNGTWIKVKEIR